MSLTVTIILVDMYICLHTYTQVHGVQFACVCQVPFELSYNNHVLYIHPFYRSMIVDLECSKTQETPMFKFENEADKNQYVRMYKI